MKENLNLTEGNILKNLILLSLPIMLSNFMGTLYNLVDTYWLGKIASGAKEAVAVTGMTFPLSFFIMSFAAGFTVAGTAIVSKFKGMNDAKNIKLAIGQFVPIMLVFSVILVIITQTLIPTFLRLLQTPPEIMSDAHTYITYILYGMIAMMFFMVFQSITTAFGDSFTPMVVQVITVILNLILDPLMIFGVWFFPEMGIKGAAIATLISRIIASLIAFLIFIRKYKSMIPSWKDMIPQKSVMTNILQIGLPASIGQSTTSLGFLLVQGLVNSFGTTVISANSIGNRMVGIFMLPAMGISNALSSFIGQNLGAKEQERAVKSVHYAMLLVMSIMTVGSIFIYNYGSELVRFFVDEASVIAVGQRMFKITAYATWIFGILMVFMGVFNGAGHSKSTMAFNVSRLWLFRIPLAYIFAGYFIGRDLHWFSFLEDKLVYLGNILAPYQYEALWWAMVVSNTAGVIIAFSLYMKGNWKVSKAGW
ncbi:MATE family efflux transporter [bacterium]|nr:MATE family efflux transporter [bacterium]